MIYFSLVFEFGEFLWWKRLRVWADATVPNGSDRGRRKSKSCVLSAAGDSPLQGSFKPVHRKTSECSCSAAGNFQECFRSFTFLMPVTVIVWTLEELCLPLGEFLQPQIEASALSYDAIVKSGYTFGGFVASFFCLCS